MPVKVEVWKLGELVEPVQFTPIPSEEWVENIIASNTRILGSELFLIGRQVRTRHGGLIDLLALDGDGSLVVIELKRDRTPREVIAQLLDYGSWACGLEYEGITSIFDEYTRKYRPQDADLSLDQAFCRHFNSKEVPEVFNSEHELLVVASELDDGTERIVNYLNDVYGVAINAAFFRRFSEGDSEYLTMAWLIDPGEAEIKTVERRSNEPWNGEYYACFGEKATRCWADARKYGYISAGGGMWYSRALYQLEPEDRVWVNAPGHGYVGVGIVRDKAVPITEFTVPDESGQRHSIREVVERTPSTEKPVEELEHYVRVDWIKTVSLEQAIKEKGFFGNQNVIAKPRAKSWVHTVKRLKVHFEIQD